MVTSSGARILAATVIIGVGVRPANGWLASSSLTRADGVVVNEYCATNLPAVYAAGDVARWPYRPAGGAETLVRLEHYDNAIRQAESAARNMLGERVPYAPVPYFWTEQFDWMAQYVGYAERWINSFIVASQLLARARSSISTLDGYAPPSRSTAYAISARCASSRGQARGLTPRYSPTSRSIFAS
jgi:NADPH-dependent 2,4-dienoyl-CoA reductase/sulfur reductase-like enzyme